MIIKSITLNDFFRVYGEIKIICSTDSEKNVTVIKGDNGTGKTTMLSAFHWAFYGDVIEPLTTNEKNEISHRGRALNEVLKYLANLQP